MFLFFFNLGNIEKNKILDIDNKINQKYIGMQKNTEMK